MVDWVVIGLLIVFGIGLIIAEVIFIPGTTFVGILGALFIGYGVYSSFITFGSNIGWGVLIGSSVLTLVAVIYSFRSGAWKKFSLKGRITSRVNEHIDIPMKVGDVGLSLSVLKPIGKAEFGDSTYEVKTLGEYVEEGNKVKIIKIETTNIIVELIN